MNDKVISLLGLAERAGKIASGEFAAEKAVKTGKALRPSPEKYNP